MTLAEELKHLVTIRDLLSEELVQKKLSKKTKAHISGLISLSKSRIYQILDTMILQDVELREAHVKQLQESRPGWFNDLSKRILGLLVAKEVADHIDVSKIFSEIFSIF